MKYTCISLLLDATNILLPSIFFSFSYDGEFFLSPMRGMSVLHNFCSLKLLSFCCCYGNVGFLKVILLIYMNEICTYINQTDHYNSCNVYDQNKTILTVPLLSLSLLPILAVLLGKYKI